MNNGFSNPKVQHKEYKIPVGDNLELFQDEKDSTSDEKLLVLVQGFVQHQQVAILDGLNNLRELQQIVPKRKNCLSSRSERQI